MRVIAFIIVVVASLCATPAMAQTSIALNANPVPIIEARINNQPVRLEVDLRMGSFLALNPAVAQRLHVQRVPFLGIRVELDGGEGLSGRLARPRVVFTDGEDARAFTGIFAVPVTSRADGVIGPGALPYDVITVALGSTPEGAMRDIVLPVDNPDNWGAQIELAGAEMQLRFALDGAMSGFSRAAVNILDPIGRIPADGDLRRAQIILGLSTMVQPVRTDLTIQGLPIAPAFARTNAPLTGATDEETIVVTGRSDNAPKPFVTLGREALSRCTSMVMNRRAKTLTLHCAA